MTAPATHGPRGRAQRYDNGNVVTERRNGSSVTAWLTADEFRQLDAIAKARDLSKTAVVRQLIIEFLGANLSPDSSQSLAPRPQQPLATRAHEQ